MQNLNILLVTAHPDDECMFFGPSIIALSKQNNIHILCLSTGSKSNNLGNDKNQGAIRKKELKDACSVFKIKKYQIINSKNLQDGMGNHWNINEINRQVSKYIRNNNISAVITFEE
jgi:N-acetylglucosaminylphosphatidylinositol deacetylase